MEKTLFLQIKATNLPGDDIAVMTNFPAGQTKTVICEQKESLLDVWPQLKRQMLAAEVLIVFSRRELSLLDRALCQEGVTMTPCNYCCLQDKVIKLANLDSYDFETVCHYYEIKGQNYLERLSGLYGRLQEKAPFVGIDRGIKFFKLDKLQGQYRQFFADLQELEKLVAGIRCDGQVQSREFAQLKAWHTQHAEKRFTLGYAPIMSILDNILADNILTIDECDDLLGWLANQQETDSGESFVWFTILENIAPESLLKSGDLFRLCSWCGSCDWGRGQEELVKERISSLVHSNRLTHEQGMELLEKLAGWVHPQNKESRLQNRVCVLTGSFSSARNEVIAKLQKEGAIVSGAVSRNTDLLIVGGDDLLVGNRGSGRQIKKARELQEQGAPIRIVGEKELWPSKPMLKWRAYGQNAIMLLVFLNLLSAMLETLPTVVNKIGNILEYFNIFSTVVFIIEMAMRIVLDGKKFWMGHRCAWNYFDLVITLLTSITFNSAFSSFRMLRLARMMRSLRALRVFSGLRNLRQIMGAMMQSLPKIGWTFLLMLVVFLIWATIGTNLFGGVGGAEPFENIGRSLFTLVQLMTFDDLGNIANPIIAQNGWAVLYFLSFIFIISFVMLNILTGVIVDSIASCSDEEE